MKKTIVSSVLLTSVIWSSLWMWIVHADSVMWSTWTTTNVIQEQTVKAPVVSDEQKKAYQSIMQSLEAEFKSLRESITSDNIDSLKEKVESLRSTYVDKVKWFWFEQSVTDNLLKVLNTRFDVFMKSNFERKSLVQEYKDQKEQVRTDVKTTRDDLQTERQEVKVGLTQEQQAQMKTIMTSLETEIKALRESITSTNLEEIKSKIEVLRVSYTDQVKALWYEQSITDSLLKMLNERFNIFTKVNVEAKPALAEKKEAIKNVTGEVKSKRDELRTKYKEWFKKQLGTKVEKLPVEKLNRVIVNIDKLVQTITSNTSLSTTKKEALLAQLEAFKEIINDQLSTLSNTDNTTINFDSLLSQ